MSRFQEGHDEKDQGAGHPRRWSTAGLPLVVGVALLTGQNAHAAINCERTLTADVVAIDQPLMFNRLGAQNVNSMIYALKDDVVDSSNKPLTRGGAATPGQVTLRPDKRPRPLVLKIAVGECLTVNLTNLLTPNANPFNADLEIMQVDDQVADRTVGFQVQGMEAVNTIADISANTGRNASALAPQGGSRSYTLYGAKEGAYTVTNYGATFGSDGTAANIGNGLFGQVVVVPKGGRNYRNAVTEEEMRLATRKNADGTLMRTGAGQPIIDYEARYPEASPWTEEGKAGRPILRTVDTNGNRIVHSDGDTIVMGPNADGSFPPSTYPLESIGKVNPAYPNRLEAFRDFASIWHDEMVVAQAFPGFFNDPVFGHVLGPTRDAFMINYGSGGIGSEIVANRLGVGPMHDCLACEYEEFFLSSYTVGDPAMLVDVPANVGLETLVPGQAPPPGTTGIKATKALFPNDPSNVHHSYIGDFVKIRNTHVGHEHHVFHLHNHQWLFNPNDDNSNYIDAQGIGPGSTYTHELTFGGAGNRNRSPGDAIYHCHFYPHFAQGMWYHLRVHDTFEAGTQLAVSFQEPAGAAEVITVTDATVEEVIRGNNVRYNYNVTGETTVAANNSVTVEVLNNAGQYRTLDTATVDATTGAWVVSSNNSNIVPSSPLGVRVTSSNGGMYPQPEGAIVAEATGFHTTPFALRDGTPAPGARALPDGELVVGSPIPAVVPLPGKAMPPMPGQVAVVPKVVDRVEQVTITVTEGRGRNRTTTTTVEDQVVRQVVGSVAKVDRSDANRYPDGRLKNPGFPFWIAGIEETVGQRPPTPPLDMLDQASAQALRDSGDDLWSALAPAQAQGWDGGLPRHTLEGVASGGVSVKTTTPLDFSVKIEKAKPVFFDEEGTDVEQAAMAFHAKKNHPSYALKPNGEVSPASFRTNGAPPMAGSPFAEPCTDDDSNQVTAWGDFFNGNGGMTRSPSPFHALNPRVYKGAAFQFDAVFNKEGWHYPQQRIMALWEDVMPVIRKEKPPEPMTLRLNTFDCAMFYHTNLIPKQYEADDYQITTPTDIMGQHIHLPKWDLTTTDGAANGWNYEDGTLAPGAIADRIKAIRAFNNCGETEESASCPKAKNHPFFAQFGRADWVGARTTMQRWFADPIYNVYGVDRGLGNVFTHDHYTPSTAQQNGLYATVLTQPAGSTWRHSETGELMYTRPDGGPTSWQAVIETGDIDGDGRDDSYREFFLQYSDFQHAYEAGVYVAAGPDGVPNPTAYPLNGQTWRNAINPPGRKSAEPLFPDLQVVRAQDGVLIRPFPQAISVDDPGTFVVNYRNEPIGLRIYDPNRMGPDGKPGMQAEGLAGDLAYALQSRTDRVISSMNERPRDITQKTGPTGGVTVFPPHINFGGDLPGDPFTPMLRIFAGDNVRVRVQAGGHEEEHNVSIHGVKWLQGGSGFGQAPNSGWRNAQMAGISEQYTFASPVDIAAGAAGAFGDHLYTVSSGFEGYWNGSWGIMRNYRTPRPDLFALPNNPRPVALRNSNQFQGVCPVNAPQRNSEVVVALANDILPKVNGVIIGDPVNEKPGNKGHVGAPLMGEGTLVYNSRATAVDTGQSGPLHDPTAILYVRKSDLDPDTGKLRMDVPIEPLILRAAAGDCINVTLENRLPAEMPDLPAYVVHAQLVKRDRGEGQQDQTSFNNNLMRPSAHVGLHAQLLAVDVTRSDGINVGRNQEQTVPPRAEGETEFPTRTYQYYAGDLSRAYQTVSGPGGRNLDNVVATPVEFAGLNLMPADVIKQPQKGLTGAMVIHPQGATWTEDADMRAAATVTAPDQPEYRDFAVQWQKGLNMRWADGTPVANIATEGVGVQADPKDNSGMALNYRAEPLWYRFGLAPDTPFGTAGQPGSLGAVANANEAYSNALVGGDPETPVLKVGAGEPFRIQVTNAAGGERGGVFGLHGHIWQRDPYLAQNVDTQGFPDKHYGVGSVRIGHNPIGMWLGGQESILPRGHFTFVFNSAGGGNAVAGDYLMRDIGSFGNLSGRWGILRVE